MQALRRVGVSRIDLVVTCNFAREARGLFQYLRAMCTARSCDIFHWYLICPTQLLQSLVAEPSDKAKVRMPLLSWPHASLKTERLHLRRVASTTNRLNKQSRQADQGHTSRPKIFIVVRQCFALALGLGGSRSPARLLPLLGAGLLLFHVSAIGPRGRRRDGGAGRRHSTSHGGSETRQLDHLLEISKCRGRVLVFLHKMAHAHDDVFQLSSQVAASFSGARASQRRRDYSPSGRREPTPARSSART